MAWLGSAKDNVTTAWLLLSTTLPETGMDMMQKAVTADRTAYQQDVSHAFTDNRPAVRQPMLLPSPAVPQCQADIALK